MVPTRKAAGAVSPTREVPAVSALSDALNEANVDGLSARAIARLADDRVSHSQLGKYLKPDHPQPGDEVLSVFAEVLHLPITHLRGLAGQPTGELGAWVPPPEAHRLNRRQRRLLDELIRVLADAPPRDGAPTLRAVDLAAHEEDHPIEAEQRDDDAP